MEDFLKEGEDMLSLAKKLYPICRSITGDGVRETFHLLNDEIGSIALHEVPSGTQCFDWTVPREWNIRSAYIEDPDGNKIVDFADNNLHVLGYSVPVDTFLPLEELDKHLHSIPEMPDAIPYVTSYYSERWGFCLPHEQRLSLKPGMYRAVVDSSLEDGNLTYGEVLLPGQSEEEVFLTCYICHPSMANNELSGPVVVTALVKWLQSQPQRRYSYRIVFAPETIGAIVYLSRNLEAMKQKVIAGFNISCIGDERCYSYLPSRAGDTLADRTALHVLKHVAGDFKKYTFLDRGSDERQYCAPGVDLPVVTMMRSKFREYPEYHTSKDDFSVVTAKGLAGGYAAIRHCIDCIENNRYPRTKVLCEPQLGKRGLYPTINTAETRGKAKARMNFLAYCEGEHDLISIAETINRPFWELVEDQALFLHHDLIEISDSKWPLAG